MRTCVIAAFVLVLAATAAGQVTVTGTTPTNNATGVSLTTTLSMTFSAALDTTVLLTNGENVLTNLPQPSSYHWSTDSRTFYADVVLQPNTVYFLLMMYVTPAAGGFTAVPYVFYFTTAASFPSNLYTVSGTITPGTTGINPANAMIVLLGSPFQGNPQDMFTGAISDGSGNFVIPYVPAGTWYPLAAKDVQGDGYIDPSGGDGIGYGDSVTVTTGNVNGLTVQLMTFLPKKYMDVRDPVLSYAAANLPSNRELRTVISWAVDSIARSSEWIFIYTVPGTPGVSPIRADQFGVYPDPYSNWDWIGTPRVITDLLSAALPDSVIARTERSGGAAFRTEPPPDPQAQMDVYLRGGDLTWSEFYSILPDASKNYWGVNYQWRINISQDSSYSIKQKLFVADWTTGEILTFTGVKDKQSEQVPSQYSLGQNYPNPFNPSTSISFGLPFRSQVRLEVYNLLGQRVASLVNEERNAGTYEVTWSPSLPSGVYLYRLEATGNEGQKFSQVRKMALLK